MNKILFLSLFTIHLLLFTIFCLLFTNHYSLATDHQSLITNNSVSVSGSIGENLVTIYGYTSPLSRVELSSPRVFAVTFSQADGYYEFTRTLLPKNPQDLCLYSFDDTHANTSPICIPPPPPTNYHTSIGPILLPPTIAFDAATVSPQSTTYASGQSIPNSEIGIYLYQVNNRAPIFPKIARAFSLPVFSTISDSNGNYNFTLPTALSSNYRLFSTVKFMGSASPKSNTLIYTLPSLWYLFWLQNSWLIVTLILFVLTLTLLFYLIYLNYIAKTRYLPALFRFPLSITNKSV